MIFSDRVAVVTTTTGTGPVALGAALFSYQSFAAGFPDGTIYYGILDETSGDWEIGVGTLSSGGTSLARDSVIASSAGGAFVSLSAGDKVVYAPNTSVGENLDMGTF